MPDPGKYTTDLGVVKHQNPTLDAGLLIFRELTIRGFWLTDWMCRVDSQTRQAIAQQVIGLLASGQIQLPVEATYSLDAIREAVKHAETPGRFGKILLKP